MRLEGIDHAAVAIGAEGQFAFTLQKYFARRCIQGRQHSLREEVNVIPMDTEASVLCEEIAGSLIVLLAGHDQERNVGLVP